MKRMIITAWIFISGICLLGAQSPWLTERMAEIDEAEKLPSDGMFGKIGYLLGIGAGKNLREEQRQVFERVKSLMLRNPGHARFYKDKLDKAREDFLNKRIAYHTYEDAQGDVEVLKYLPSPESVAVLGELIEDPVGRDGKLLDGAPVSYGDGDFPVNCKTAYYCLRSIGIENGPITTRQDEYGWAAVDKWKDWWREVKSGKRTYRFKGSAVEYGPAGPVGGAQLDKIARDRHREAERKAARDKTKREAAAPREDARNRPTKAWPIATALAAVIALVIWLRGRRRQA